MKQVIILRSTVSEKIHNINTQVKVIFESINCYFFAKFFSLKFRKFDLNFIDETFSGETFRM